MPPSPTDAAARLRLLYEVTSLRVGPLEARLDAALEVVTEALDLDVGVVSRIENGSYTVERVYAPSGALYRGQTTSLERTYSSLTLQAGGVLSISHMGASPYTHLPLYRTFNYESYIGAAVTVQGALYGTLAFLEPPPARCRSPLKTRNSWKCSRAGSAWCSRREPPRPCAGRARRAFAALSTTQPSGWPC